MKIIIKKPDKDVPKNSKENVFLAFDENNSYLGHGYVFPYFNYEVTYEHPLNIFIDINVPSNDQEVKDTIFDNLINRAETIRKATIGINTRIYGGAPSQERDKILYLISKGFIADEGAHLLRRG